jgi:hypothetical protein
MHRELHRVYTSSDLVIAEVSPQGTDKGSMDMGTGVIAHTGKRMDAPCCDVFTVKNDKTQVFNCYKSVFVMLFRLGVLPDLRGT